MNAENPRETLTSQAAIKVDEIGFSQINSELP